MSFKITILSDVESWINKYIPKFISQLKENGHIVLWIHRHQDIHNGDLLFCLSYSNILPPNLLFKNVHNLVVHESALPKGKGWSPLTWQILEGNSCIPISLLEMDKQVDSGVIYLQDKLQYDGSELIDELRKVQAEKTISLCRTFISNYPEIISKGIKQTGKSIYYPKRTPDDSELNIEKSILDQINLLRVVDNKKYPAYFTYKNKKYIIEIKQGK